MYMCGNVILWLVQFSEETDYAEVNHSTIGGNDATNPNDLHDHGVSRLAHDGWGAIDTADT
jgi:hypothetical protein